MGKINKRRLRDAWLAGELTPLDDLISLRRSPRRATTAGSGRDDGVEVAVVVANHISVTTWNAPTIAYAHVFAAAASRCAATRAR